MIFLYHGVVPERIPSDRWRAGQAVPREDFERQVIWLAKRRRIVPLAEYVRRDPKDPEAAITVALTFDDGLRGSLANTVPFLRRHRIPATFFVTTVHVESRELLWFSYLNALCYEGIYDSVRVDGSAFRLGSFADKRRARRALRDLAHRGGDPARFSRELAARYPLRPEVASLYEGATPEDLRSVAASELFEVGSHTLTHPYLSRLTDEAQAREVIESRTVLSEICGKAVRFFAYPAGDYDRTTLRAVREAGYEAAFATIGKGLGSDARLEIERTGVYAPSLLKVQLKAMGVVRFARGIGIGVG